MVGGGINYLSGPVSNDQGTDGALKNRSGQNLGAAERIGADNFQNHLFTALGSNWLLGVHDRHQHHLLLFYAKIPRKVIKKCLS